MPVRQYFVCVGSFLLVALFAADWWFPGPAAHSYAAIRPGDKVNLRIRSDQQWPERVVFDTAHSGMPLAAEPGPEPNVVHEDLPLTMQRSPHDAFEAVEAAPTTTPTATNENGSAIRAKPRRPRTRMTSAAKTD